MANVNLKTDFKNGEKLFDYQLNNNFAAIQAALGAMNKIVWQDEQELPDSVLAFRGTTEELMNREIIDGQLLYDVNTGETYIDYEGKRISTGSGNAIHIGEDEPTNASTQLWIPTDDFVSVGTEVVDSLEGNETHKAPSVAAVNNALATIVESGSNEKGSWVKYGDGTMIQRGSVYTEVDIKTADGSLYRPAGEIALNFPQNFINNAYQINVTSSGDIIGSYVINKGVSLAYAWCFASSSRSAKGRYLDYIAIGKWK